MLKLCFKFLEVGHASVTAWSGCSGCPYRLRLHKINSTSLSRLLSGSA
ncbi:MAG: hypothetical protein LBJ00_11385 [Planctomycetaceae bacterium]|nr:hypothetical protein [Planctomycetaceae bacterium]